MNTTYSHIPTDERMACIELAACYRLAADRGWDELVSTHISARVPGHSSDILLNPFGMLFGEVTASNLVRVAPDGGIRRDESGSGYNKGGFITHSLIHSARADADCIVHLHPMAGVAISCDRRGLLPLTEGAADILADLAYFDYEPSARHLESPERLLEALGACNYLILRNHGLLVIGTTIREAWMRMYKLVRACELQLLLQAGSPSAVPVPLRNPHRVSPTEKERRLNDLAWAAELRRLDCLDASYKS